MIKNKDEARFNAGSFIFGFKIYDSTGSAFWDTSYINWKIVTEKRVWVAANQGYVNTTTEYFLAPC